jgi:hypothetical protein
MAWEMKGMLALPKQGHASVTEVVKIMFSPTLSFKLIYS